ncbi:hypothetical protein BUALT_Bualt07G0175900 [Buddleja alternifolia]|uniref:Pentatricopeptide repeat-containing protein n=1 Tax=Buddleja alternifolia TaxID=168488 RepID=A0AAV6XFW6_9LAMI|nr:hypothetical protein BUALT_Bualt07G0175900 [Buddleja alternifolia]
MIWRRWRYKFLANFSFFPCKLPSFAAAAIHHLADSSEPGKSSIPFKPKHTPNTNTNTISLNPHIVQTTLHNSPSDLIALSFFLWCARQPHYFHDKPTFHHMVTLLSNLTNKHGTVKGILQQLESIGCITKPQTLLLLMRIYWCGAMYDMVLEAFQEMRNYGYIPNTYVRNIVMDVLFKIRRVDAALRVLEETDSPNFLSFSIAICNLCSLNDVNNVKIVLRCMLMKGYYMNPETYSLVLNCFCKFARLAEALQLLDIMIVLGAPVSVNVWSILIDGLCKSGQIEVAAYLLEKMVEIGCSPNIVTCTSLIKGFLESRMPGKAFEILDTLEAKGCFPDLILCNVLIDCLSKMGWYKDAFEVFSSLRERSLVPDVYTFSSLVTTICLSRQYVLLPLLTSGLAVEPDLVVCNCLISYFCKAGYPDGSVEFYNDIIDRGFQPDKYSFAGVLSALCRSGKINEAVNVYHGMIRSQQDIDAHIHTIMVNGLIKSGSLQKAIRLFRKASAEKFPLDVMSYNVAIEGLLRGGQREEAYALFSEMKQMDITPNDHSYNLILYGFCKDRDVNMVKHILQEMADRNIELDFKTYKLMNNLLQDSPHSLLVFNLFSELRNSGLLPKVGQGLLVDGQAGAYTSFVGVADPQDVLDIGTSSSDDLSDAVVSVG